MAKFKCRQPFSFDVDGASRVYVAGDVLDSTDPAFTGREELFHDAELFEPLEAPELRRAGVEQATAAPGEKRSIQPPGKTPEPPTDTPKRTTRRRTDKEAS